MVVQCAVSVYKLHEVKLLYVASHRLPRIPAHAHYVPNRNIFLSTKNTLPHSHTVKSSAHIIRNHTIMIIISQIIQKEGVK